MGSTLSDDRYAKMKRHELFDYSIYECVLEGARGRIEKATDIELPGFYAWLEDTPTDFDPETDERIVGLRYDSWLAFGNFYIPDAKFYLNESVLKGIAAGRGEDVEAFLEAFLPTYRAEWIAACLKHEFHTDPDLSPDNDDRILSTCEVNDAFREMGTEHWYIAEVKATAASSILFKLTLVLRDFMHQFPAKNYHEIEYDQRELPFPLSWDEFVKATSDHEGLIALLAKICQSFLVMKDDLPGSYSEELSNAMARLDDDYDYDEEDPFTSGELVFDADDRVHLASDLED